MHSTIHKIHHAILKNTISKNDDTQFLQGNAALYATHGKVYTVGCIPCILYLASGIAKEIQPLCPLRDLR
jgi:hypothetical protein